MRLDASSSRPRCTPPAPPFSLQLPSRLPSLLVTGSSGLIGSAVTEHFIDAGWTVHGLDNNQRAVFFGPEGDTRWNQQRLEDTHAGVVPAPRAGHPRPRRRARPARRGQARRRRPRRRAALARPRGRHPVRRLRHQRRRHAEPARGRRAGTRPTRRSRTSAPTRSTATRPTRSPSTSSRRATTTPTRPSRRHPRDVPHRPVQALALRRLEGRRGRDGAGVRPLLRHADVRAPRRLPHRPGPLGRRAARLPELPHPLQRRPSRPYTVFGYKGKQVRDNIHATDVARFIARFIDGAAPGRGLQPRRRPRQLGLDDRGLRPRRGPLGHTR